MKWAASKSDGVRWCRLVSGMESNGVLIFTSTVHEESIAFLFKLAACSTRPSSYETLYLLINRKFWTREPCCKRCLIRVIEEVVNLKVWLDSFRWEGVSSWIADCKEAFEVSMTAWSISNDITYKITAVNRITLAAKNF